MLDLSLGLVVNDRTSAIYDGRVAPEGIRFTTSRVNGSELYWRQLMFGDFDVSDMSMASLLIATDRGETGWTALPIFSLRKFFHTWAIVCNDAKIAQPADLHGKRVGVPEYQQTSAVWARGILFHEFGVDWRRINWFMERPPERSHGGATGFSPPEGVQLAYVPQESSLAQMLIDGELDASLSHLSLPNLVDRGRIDLATRPEVRPLFDAEPEGARYYGKTRILPFNHGVVVRRSVADAHPWVPLNVYSAFVRAKEIAARHRIESLEPYFDAGLVDRKQLASDLTPYGFAANRRDIGILCEYLYEQGLTSRVVQPDEVFAASTLDL